MTASPLVAPAHAPHGFDIWNVLFAALDCLCDAITDRPVCSCSLVGGTGPMPPDSCVCEGDACGTAWVRLDSVFPSVNFPNVDGTSGCTAPLAYRFHVGVVRCQPGPDETGGLPGPDELTAAAQASVADMQASYLAVRCCLTALPPRSVNLGAWVPVGDEASCSGGYWPVTVWGM